VIVDVIVAVVVIVAVQVDAHVDVNGIPYPHNIRAITTDALNPVKSASSPAASAWR